MRQYTRLLTAGIGMAGIFLGALASGAEETSSSGKGESDAQQQWARLSQEAKVLSKIHHTNQMEIQAGKLAMEKGHSEDVRDYGERLRRDHQNADKRLKALVEQEDVPLVKPQPQTEKEKKQAKKQKQTMQKLQTLEGEEFDEAFLKFMVEGHQHSIQTLSKAHEKLEDPDVRDLVGKLIPILEQHLQLAKNLRGEPEPATAKR